MSKIKYNIYRLRKELKDVLIKKLTSDSVGLQKSVEKEINGYKLVFFFSTKPDKVEIWWTTVYKDFLDEDEKPKNRIYFAVLLIFDDEKFYAVSLGKSHFYLKSFCDPDFGLDLAQRIADENDFRVKNSKFYKSMKSKTITTYQPGNRIDYDSGESMHYLRAKTIDPLLWGKIASFGNSAQLELSILPMELPALIEQIENELKKPARFEMPKADIVRDNNKIKEMDKKLARAIMASSSYSNISVDEFSVSGVDFIFSDRNNHSLYFTEQSTDKEIVGELSIEKLAKFARNRNINLEENINKIYVFIYNEYGRGHGQPIKTLLDFVDEKERYCLLDGQWHIFNQSYLKYLVAEVDRLNFSYNALFDINDKDNEDAFNKAREANDGYINLDKSLTTLDGKYKWEKMDLYRDKTLYFVKIGTPQKLAYVVDQSVTTVRILQQHESGLDVNGKACNVKKICLWLILDRKTQIQKLSDINSIIFHMKLVDWKKSVTNAGYEPEVRVNYVV